jgi:hypothetical protein
MGHLNNIAREIHQTAQEKGWWEEGLQFGQRIALTHSELSEALEEWRKVKDWLYYTPTSTKPEGVSVELVDAMIRILDILYSEDVDIDKVMRLKMDYNKTRPYRHGGLRA